MWMTARPQRGVLVHRKLAPVSVGELDDFPGLVDSFCEGLCDHHFKTS